MKAVVFDEFGGPEALKYVDLPVPVPGMGQVLARMRSAGVCKADWRVRTGRCQWLAAPFPVTLGYVVDMPDGLDGDGVRKQAIQNGFRDNLVAVEQLDPGAVVHVGTENEQVTMSTSTPDLAWA